MKILKPIQNKLKKRFEFVKCNKWFKPGIFMQNNQQCSFKTLYIEVPFVGSFLFTFQK